MLGRQGTGDELSVLQQLRQKRQLLAARHRSLLLACLPRGIIVGLARRRRLFPRNSAASLVPARSTRNYRFALQHLRVPLQGGLSQWQATKRRAPVLPEESLLEGHGRPRLMVSRPLGHQCMKPERKVLQEQLQHLQLQGWTLLLTTWIRSPRASRRSRST